MFNTWGSAKMIITGTQINSIHFAEVTHNGRPNPSLSEDSVAETALAKKNSDGKSTVWHPVKSNNWQLA